MRWAGHTARIQAMSNSYKIMVGKPGRKRPLGRSTCRREDILDIWIYGF